MRALHALDCPTLVRNYEARGAVEVVGRPQLTEVQLGILELRRLYYADCLEAVARHLTLIVDDLLRVDVDLVADEQAFVIAAVEVERVRLSLD